MIVFLGGCMNGRFDCPLNNEPSCKSVSQVSAELHQKEDPKNVIYLWGK